MALPNQLSVQIKDDLNERRVDDDVFRVHEHDTAGLF
jgi:hypothetical protein